MKKNHLQLIVTFFTSLLLYACSESEEKHVIADPTVLINKIWIDDVEYEAKDIITLDKASKVKMEYTVKSEAQLIRVNNYYVYGTTGSLISENSFSTDEKEFSGTLYSDDFMPFACGFTVVALDIYGGATSKGFSLELPASSLDDISGNTPAASQQDKKLGPNQKVFFWNGKLNGRYKPSDVARNVDRLSSTDFAYNFIDGEHYLFSVSEWDERYPSDKIVYEGDSKPSDAPITKFAKLERFTSSMWTAMNTNEKFQYLANSIEPTETSIRADKVGDYFFYKNGLGGVGIINIKALKDSPEGKEEVQVLVKAYKYW